MSSFVLTSVGPAHHPRGLRTSLGEMVLGCVLKRGGNSFIPLKSGSPDSIVYLSSFVLILFVAPYLSFVMTSLAANRSSTRETLAFDIFVCWIRSF